MQSGAIASRFRAVSSSVSPLVTLEVDALMLMASAERRFAAITNDVRVRVEGSKKRLITVRPRNAGTFLISRREMSRKDSAVSKICVISPAESSRMLSRCLRLKIIGLWFLVLGLWTLVFERVNEGSNVSLHEQRPKSKDLRPTQKKRPLLAAVTTLLLWVAQQLRRLLPHQNPRASLL